MGSFWTWALSFTLIGLWIISGYFATVASLRLSSFSDTDDFLHRAYWFTFWAAFVTWTLLIIFVLLVILAIVGVVALFGSGVGEVGVAAEGAEASTFTEYASSQGGQALISTGVSWLTIAFLIFALILVIITGVLTAIAAASIAESPNYNSSNADLSTAYTDCIIAASLCLGTAGLLLIGLIVYSIIAFRRQQERNKELAEIDQIRARALRQRLLDQARQEQLTRQQEYALRQQWLQQGYIQPTSQPAPRSSTVPITLVNRSTTPVQTVVPSTTVPSISLSQLSRSTGLPSSVSNLLS
jgi:Uncharacterized protein conserved in bacteria